MVKTQDPSLVPMELFIKCLSSCVIKMKEKKLVKSSVDDPNRTKTKVEEKLEFNEKRLVRLPTGNMKHKLGFREKRDEFSKNFGENEATDGPIKSRLNLADVKKKAEHNESEIVDGIEIKIDDSINHLIDIPPTVAQGFIQNGHAKFTTDDDKRNLNKELSLNGNLAPKSKQTDSDMAAASAKFKRQVPNQYGSNNMETPNQNRPVIVKFPAGMPAGTTRARLNLVGSPGQRALSNANVGRLIGNNFYYQRRTAAGDNTGAGGQERIRSNGGFQEGDDTALNGIPADLLPAGLNAGRDQFGVANTDAARADIANRIQGPPTYGRNEAGNLESHGDDYRRIGNRANGRFGSRNVYKSLTNQYGASERTAYGAGVPRNNVYLNEEEPLISEGHAILNAGYPRDFNPPFTNSNQYEY
uniref:Uncharacterized protein n=2 Tax=Rhodnius prolixus TaxID=13249 RepID=T1HPV1_RHOPR